MPRKLIYKMIRVHGSLEARAFEKATHNPLAAQKNKLTSIIKKSQASKFGLEHNFSAIKTIEDFQKSVPIRTYEELSPYIERACAGEKGVLTEEDPFMFATTSGTTASPKFIPVTKSYVEEFRLASIVSGYHLVGNFPDCVDGYVMPVVSPAEEGRTSGGLPYGAISGLMYLNEPWYVKKFVLPIPYEIYLIRDYESRYYTLLRAALCLPLSIIYTMNPSTVLLLAKRMERYGTQLIRDIRNGTLSPPSEIPAATREALAPFCVPNPKRAAELEDVLKSGRLTPQNAWQNLATICCWTKAAASFYLADIPEFYGDVPVCDITYGASEGRGTVTLGPDRQVLSVRSHFFEFIPEDEIGNPSPRVLTCDQVEAGQNYYILFTNSGGLYRYNINDVVKVTGFHNKTPLIEFQYKGGNVSSFTGEKVTEIQVTEAMKKTLIEMKQKVSFFTLIPQFRPNPHYELWLEPPRDATLTETSGISYRKLAESFDHQLSEQNVEYKSKRESERLDPIEIRLIVPGSYEFFRKKMSDQGVPDAQIKVSHLNPKKEIKAYFESKLVAPQQLGLPDLRQPPLKIDQGGLA